MSRTNNRFYLVLAIALHLVLFAALFMHFATTATQQVAAAPTGNIVKAVVIAQQSQPQPAPKLEPKPTVKPEPQPVPQIQPKSEPEPEPAPAPAPAPKSEPKPKKVEPKPQPKSQPTPQPQQQIAQQEQAELRIKKQQEQKQEQQHLAQIEVQKKQAKMQQQAKAHQAAERKQQVAEQVQKELAAQQKEATLQTAKEDTQKLLEQEISAATNTDTTKKDIIATTANQGAIDKYKALIIAAISQQWIVPSDVQSSRAGKLLVRLAPGGVVLKVEITQSSGDAALDRSARTAILKASPLPTPTESALFNKFREISLTVRPQGISAGG